jgi:hypothetical protein
LFLKNKFGSFRIHKNQTQNTNIASNGKHT